jgi:hypothetical protein
MAPPATHTGSATPKPATSKRATSARKATTRKRATAPAPAPAKNPADVVSEYAERAVLIPVGAALTARDRVVASVNDVITTYSTPSKAQTQLKKFERRGVSARKDLERQVRKTRTLLEREMRQRRRRLEKTVTRLDRRRGTAAKNLTSQVEQASTQIENAVQSGIKETSELASRVQERVLNRA